MRNALRLACYVNFVLGTALAILALQRSRAWFIVGLLILIVSPVLAAIIPKHTK